MATGNTYSVEIERYDREKHERVVEHQTVFAKSFTLTEPAGQLVFYGEDHQPCAAFNEWTTVTQIYDTP